jgi:carboxyl-terminal processing protease
MRFIFGGGAYYLDNGVDEAPWPKAEAEADGIWRGRIMSELLQEHLSENPIEPGPQLITRRYERLARNVHEQDKDEQVKLFLDALSQAYDPHSEYLSKADLKNFSINMGLSLVGIGTTPTEDGYAKIESLVPGGPAQTDSRLKVGDRITAVAQGGASLTTFAMCVSTKSSTKTVARRAPKCGSS